MIITPYIAISTMMLNKVCIVSENIMKILKNHFLLYNFCASCKRHAHACAFCFIVRKIQKMEDEVPNEPSTSAGERTVSFKGSEELCEVEYIDIDSGDYIESTSEGEVLSSGDDDDAEMLQTVFEGVYSTSFVSARNDPVERDSLLLLDKDLMESDSECCMEGNLSEIIYRGA